MRRWLSWAALIVVVWGAGHAKWPFIWIFASWTVFLFGWAVAAQRRRVAHCALCFAGPALLLTGAEIALTIDPYIGGTARYEGSYESGALWAEHPALGYAPPPGLQVFARRVVRGKAIYEVTYTYDEHRQRTPPPVAVEPPLGAILCFGGSYTLGEGVEDDETYPFRLGELLGRRYQVLNFGFHGYGTHHMLAALQADGLDRKLRARPRLAVYLAIPDHVVRAAGRKSWDAHGPWYRAVDGAVQHGGTFDERPSPPLVSSDWLADRFAGSALLRRFYRDPVDLRPEDLALFEGLVRASRDLVVARDPGAEFHVLAWDGPEAWWASIERLRAAGVRVHTVHEMLPNLGVGQRIPTLPDDPHPTAAVYDAIARYVAGHILGP